MKKVICLLYHRIYHSNDGMYNIVMSPKRFEEHIKFLASNYDIVRLDEDIPESDKLQIVITFDDGYFDNQIYALPIIEKYGVNATFFITTGHIGKNENFWYDELTASLSEDEVYPNSFQLNDELYSYKWETKTIEQRMELSKDLRWLLRMESEDSYIRSYLEQLEVWKGRKTRVDKEKLSLTKEQLKIMASSKLVTIGGHSVTHKSLGSLTYEQQKEEIEESIRYLREEIGARVETYSYPFGAGFDYNEDSFHILKENGIKRACSTEAIAWDVGVNEYTIPRITVENWTTDYLREVIKRFEG